MACIAIIASCQQTPEISNEVTITGQVDNPTGETVTLRKASWVGDDVEVASDSLVEGQFSMKVTVNEPSLYRLRVGREQAQVFLHPGDEIQVQADGQDFSGTLLYDGTGAKANNYLAEKQRRSTAFNSKYEQDNIYREELQPFLERNKAMRELQTELYTKRFGAGVPSDEFATFAQTEILAAWAQTQTNYPDYHEYYAGLDSFEVDDSYYDFQSELPLDLKDELIAPGYRSFVKGYGARKLNDMIAEDETLQEDWPSAYRKLYERMEGDEALGAEAKDFLLGAQLYDYISFFGVDGIDPLYEKYSTSNLNPALLEAIDKNYQAWSKLAVGQKAPDFKYTSIEGGEMSLSDLEGSVVYVDVWATWCGPCKREIPASKELKKVFADQDDVAFMYVSVDDDQEAWKKYLADDPEFKGIHLITGTGWKSDITDEYMIKGIPRYMLIDRNGNIASASAPRPSSGDKIKGMIRDLLESSEPSGD